MKARIPHYRTAAEKRAIKQEIYAEWNKIQQHETRKMAERCLKVFLFVLNRDHHFGKKRANEFYTTCGELLKEADTNEVFWEQIDRVVIDVLGISDFGRDYTHHGKAIRDDDL